MLKNFDARLTSSSTTLHVLVIEKSILCQESPIVTRVANGGRFTHHYRRGDRDLQHNTRPVLSKFWSSSIVMLSPAAVQLPPTASRTAEHIEEGSRTTQS